jgi:hypothetical protein
VAADLRQGRELEIESIEMEEPDPEYAAAPDHREALTC